jgi:hypothetical protein
MIGMLVVKGPYADMALCLADAEILQHRLPTIECARIA